MKIPLVLASQSPRRKFLLEKLQIKFEVFPTYVSEDIEENLSPTDQVRQISERKFRAAARAWKAQKSSAACLILTADTLVFLEERPGSWIALGKPADLDEAKGMLTSLSGREHKVITAMTLGRADDEAFETHLDEALVWFKKLSANDIQSYIEKENVLDKAGSYGFQGQGKVLVDRFEGEEETIIGLNTGSFTRLLQKWQTK